jgi:multiple sugar transport system permease protein
MIPRCQILGLGIGARLVVGVANMVGEYRVQWNELMAASVIATVPALILFSLFSRHLVTAITAGGVKG